MSGHMTNMLIIFVIFLIIGIFRLACGEVDGIGVILFGAVVTTPSIFSMIAYDTKMRLKK